MPNLSKTLLLNNIDRKKAAKKTFSESERFQISKE